MTSSVFWKVILMIPPTSNTTGNTKTANRTKKIIAAWQATLQDVTSFAEDARLYGRVVYFNHERVGVRDIHNIIKPLFDSLESYVYKDDKQVCHFEGYRLDMEYNNAYFEVELNVSAEPDLVKVLFETGCLIEIGLLPLQPSTLVQAKWLQVDD